jgi:hypothetical protein
MAENDVIERERVAMTDASGNITNDESEAVSIEEHLTLRNGEQIMQISSGPAAGTGAERP